MLVNGGLCSFFSVRYECKENTLVNFEGFTRNILASFVKVWEKVRGERKKSLRTLN